MITNLSEHLSLAEVTKSQTALRKNIDNTPGAEHLENLKRLATELFEPIRAAVSADRGVSTPIPISSGYRSVALNKAIGGSNRSQHSKGQALDLDMDGWYDDYSNSDLFYLIMEEFNFDQLIWEYGNEDDPDWVHVSYVSADENRKLVTVAKKVNSKTVYEHAKS